MVGDMTWSAAQPSGPPSGGVPVTIQASYPAIAFTMALFKPVLELPDRTRIPLNWGTTQVYLPAGAYQVRIFVPYLWDTCVGHLNLDTRYGQPVTVYYAVPYWAFASAAVGYEPQQHPGLGIYLAVLAIPVVLLLLLFGCVCLGLIIPGLSSV